MKKKMIPVYSTITIFSLFLSLLSPALAEELHEKDIATNINATQFANSLTNSITSHSNVVDYGKELIGNIDFGPIQNSVPDRLDFGPINPENGIPEDIDFVPSNSDYEIPNDSHNNPTVPENEIPGGIGPIEVPDGLDLDPIELENKIPGGIDIGPIDPVTGLPENIDPCQICGDKEYLKDLYTSITANGYLQENHNWTITKEVNPKILKPDKNNGTATWTITVVKEENGLTSAFIEGNISITNRSDKTTDPLMIKVNLSKPPSDTAISSTMVDSNGNDVLDPGETGEYNYRIDIPIGQIKANDFYRVTVEITAGHGSPAKGTKTSKIIQLENGGTGSDTIQVEDVLDNNIENTRYFEFEGSGSKTYTEQFTCDQKGDHTNIATIKETGDQASATVIVQCGDGNDDDDGGCGCDDGDDDDNGGGDDDDGDDNGGGDDDDGDDNGGGSHNENGSIEGASNDNDQSSEAIISNGDTIDSNQQLDDQISHDKASNALTINQMPNTASPWYTLLIGSFAMLLLTGMALRRLILKRD